MAMYDFRCARTGAMTWRICLIADADKQVCDCGAPLAKTEEMPPAQVGFADHRFRPGVVTGDGQRIHGNIDTARRYRGRP